MAKPPASRKNHYVPEWYQVGFAIDRAPNWLLDLQPITRPDGTPITAVPRARAPASGFWEKDLYVTRFGDELNDQVETVLFQGIDDFGADAVRAFISGDPVQVQVHYQCLFDYLGAQKLRTPKGLDWIRSRYPALNQVELLVEMQHLRQMFGTIWVEGVVEIVSARASDVKFLISDHPVTTYTAALAAQAPPIYPDDASVVLNGTQTLFALDGNHLLILTHLPYAQAPMQVPMLRKRTNARHFGHTLMRTHALIRERSLTTDEVIGINHVLKQRAHRYIAASAPQWLYPERQAAFDLERTARVLLPPQDALFDFGGEIYISYEDGTTEYRDEFGRTSKGHEFIAKELPTEPVQPGDPCPCGRGDTFGACCKSITQDDRPPWDVMSLRERNFALIRAIHGVLGLDEATDWVQVRRDLSDEQVERLHRIYQFLWPESTDLTQLLPAPGDGKSRAIFMGLSDPRTVAESVISMVPLFDQVLVLNPFINPRHNAPEFSPLKRPGAFKQQMLKNIVFLIRLAPLIQQNKVVLFPDPSDFDSAFRMSIHSMAQERTTGWKMSDELMADYRWLGEDDFRRSMRQMPAGALAKSIRDTLPDLSDEEVDKLIDYFRREGEADPMALLQVRPAGESGSHFIISRSVNLELGLFIAQMTGAVPVTDNFALWEHLHLHTRATDDLVGEGDRSRFVTVPYRGYLHQDDVLEATLLQSALALKKLLVAVQLPTEAQVPMPARLNAVRHLFSLVPIDLGASCKHADLVAPMHLTLSMPTAGFASSVAQRLNVAFGRDQAPRNLPLAMLRRTEEFAQPSEPGFGKRAPPPDALQVSAKAQSTSQAGADTGGEMP